MIRGFLSYIKGLGFRGIMNWVLFIIIIVGAVRFCYREYEYKRLLDRATEVEPHPETEVIKEAEEIAREVDESGRERVVFLRSAPIVKTIEDNAKVDSIAKVANVRSNKITEINQINASLSKENTDLKRQISRLSDGSLDTSFGYRDPWVSIQGYRYNDSTFRIKNLLASTDVSKIDHTRKKYWLFGQEEHLSTVYFSSPYIRVNGLQTMRVKAKKPMLDFNVDVEAKYLHAPQEILIGPKLGIDIGRLKLQGGYYLNPGGNLGNTVWYGAGYSIF